MTLRRSRPCDACTGFLAGLRSPRLDHSGQGHLDAASAQSVDAGDARAAAVREDFAEARLYSLRGESALLLSHRSERSWVRESLLYSEGGYDTEYCLELDGDPFEIR